VSAITYTDWSGGLDRRLPINVQEASRLWVLRNAYITLGKRIRKRPGLRKVATGLWGSYGLEAVSGRLKVFTDRGLTLNLPAIVDRIELDTPPWAAGKAMTGVRYADIFQGFPFIVASYAGGLFGHHWIDGGAQTYIADANNPRSGSVTKAASRIFAINGETVRYCAAGNCRDWTASDDAGFLPAALQQDTKSGATAVGTFQDALVVFFTEGAQIWDVTVDPTGNNLRKRIYGVGITDAPLSLASFANDLVFQSPFGVRSMTVTQSTDRIDDTDMGVAIDPLVVADAQASAAVLGRIQTFGVWIHQLGQYWLIMDMGTHSKVWAYTYSKSSKVACWSEYTFPARMTGIATLAGKVYMRSDDALYEVLADQFTDDGMPVRVEVQMAYQDAKAAGMSKQFWGMDGVIKGSAAVSYLYDPRDQGKETNPQQIGGDTRPGDLVPVEVCATAIAPRFVHEADEAFEIDALTLYYHELGTM
jgi:hypothetical protein